VVTELDGYSVSLLINVREARDLIDVIDSLKKVVENPVFKHGVLVGGFKKSCVAIASTSYHEISSLEIKPSLKLKILCNDAGVLGEFIRAIIESLPSGTSVSLG